jgi:hypothetical protein
MATAAEMRTANQALAKLAERDLVAFWSGLGTDDPFKLKAALRDFMVDLIATYGAAAAGLAADRYDELRAESVAIGSFRAVMAAPVAEETILAATGWALGPVFSKDQDFDASLTLLTDVGQKLVRQQARETVAESVRRDPADVSYARVPSGRTTCAFCLVLASRGAVYGSKESAGGVKGTEYHTKCNCEAEPVWSEGDMERLREQADYDPKALYKSYEKAREMASTNKLKGGNAFEKRDPDNLSILQAMREYQGFK